MHIKYHIKFVGEKENVVDFFDSDGVMIAYEVFEPATGSVSTVQEPVLLIHGFGSNGRINWISPGWVKFLTEAGRQVIVIDNRGHGESEKLYEAQDYDARIMADDAKRLLDHLNVERCDVMGYSMGARITAFLAMYNSEKVRCCVLAGMADNLVRGFGRGDAIADALLADEESEDMAPEPKAFRRFAQKTGSDLKALAACMLSRGHSIDKEMLATVSVPVLVVAGDVDDVAGPVEPLVALIPNAKGVVLPGRDHMNAVGDKGYKESVLAFFEAQ